MLELPIKEYRVIYTYSPGLYIEITKLGLDWGWVVRKDGKAIRMDTAASESSAELSALEYLKEGTN